MVTELAKRLNAVKPSATIAVAQKSAELKAAGKDIISLGVGEPDFRTPQDICSAAIAAINSGYTGYTAVDGVVELKQAVVDKFARENNLDFNLDEIIISSGAKQGCYNLAQALLNTGDEVVVPAPYWVSYPDIVRLAGAEPVIVSASIEQDFKIKAQALAAAINAKTKLFILNSPSNPTGMVYSKSELTAIAEVLRQHPNVIILCDDIYEHLVYGVEFVTLLNVAPDLKDRTLVLNGVSKAYAMTGWRIGYLAGPAEIIKACKKVQSQSTSNPCSIAQYAAIAALNGGLDCVEQMRRKFAERAELVFNLLQSVEGVVCRRTEGALYVFVDVLGAIKKCALKDDIEFAAWLLDSANVAVVPGSAFGAPGFIRISIAAADAQLVEAISRIKQALQ